MVDARVSSHYHLSVDDTSRSVADSHASPLPSPTKFNNKECEHQHTVKRESSPIVSKDGGPSGPEFEYLERRLREFGSLGSQQISPPSIIPHPPPSNATTAVIPRSGENDLISLVRAVESNANAVIGCKLAKCTVCERGLPESFHMQKPVSWLSVCKLAMWALNQDGTAYGRKWFSLGRDICPFVEVHKYVCGREFTPNWKTTIGITMSTYAKRANMFISGNPNELGLGYYMLPEDATDPYLETTPLIIGRHYRTPNPHSQSNARASTPPNVCASIPPTTPNASPLSPSHLTSGPIAAPGTPPANIHPTTPPPPRNTPTPTYRPTTPIHNRSSTPPPQAILLTPQRAMTPPPPTFNIHPNSFSIRTPSPHVLASPQTISSPHALPSSYHTATVLANVSQAQSSPPSSNDLEVASYMNDPASLMGVIRMRRKRYHGDMQRRAIGERKHTTDTERQLLLDYYDKFGTCTTVPEFTELQQRLGWDSHRTKIWLYNRKTYHHHRPGEKRKKQKTNSQSPSEEGEDSEDDMFYGDEDGDSISTDDREKGDISNEENTHEYIMELEQFISSLKRQLEAEISLKKAESEKGQLHLQKIAELEQSLARADARQDPGNANSELALLRTQNELYFNDLREEKKKRAQEEIKSLDYMAHISGLNSRIAALEKALGSPQSSSPSLSQSTATTIADAALPTTTPTSPTTTTTSKIDAQGRKVFVELPQLQHHQQPTSRPSPMLDQIPVPISPNPAAISIQ